MKTKIRGSTGADMFIDARSLAEGETLQTDICIVGAGAAGITLAREFINEPFDLIILESGDLKFKHSTQSLYRGKNVGRPYYPLEFTRQRYFGGSTNKWGGRCRPLDESDFEERDWIPDSGWPYDKAILDPYYARAHKVAKLGPYKYEPYYWQTDDKRPLALENTDLVTKVFHYSPQTNFGEEYKNEIQRANNIQTYLNANVIEIELDKDGKRVTALKIATLRGNAFRVHASQYILAASALENTRLLLVSNQVYPTGIGNQHGLVGRYFMEHFYVFDGVFISDLKEVNLNFYKVLDYKKYAANLGQTASIGLSRKVQREKKLLNACSMFVYRAGFRTLDDYYSLTGQSLYQIGQTISHNTAPSLEISGHFLQVLSNLDKSLQLVFRRIAHKMRPSSSIGLWNQFESAPNPDSRVMLSSKKDRMGINKVKLNWRLTNQDLVNYRNYRQLLREGVIKAGFAYRQINHELDSAGWPVTLVGGKHHMGTTRMHTTAQKGVVDKNCKVHGVDNLYIAGSSVFPNSGMANPTLTIIALALKLADYIKLFFTAP